MRIFLVLGFIFSCNSWSFIHLKNQYTIKKVKIQQMSDEKIPYPQARDENDPIEDLFEDPFNGGSRIAIPYRNEIGLIIQSIREVVALGQQFYEIIKQMRPVINYKTKPIQALPEVDSNDYVTTLNKMENWSLPQAKSYKVIYSV
jgi:hypothetical protein